MTYNTEEQKLEYSKALAEYVSAAAFISFRSPLIELLPTDAPAMEYRTPSPREEEGERQRR